jgi:hypothetical protein
LLVFDVEEVEVRSYRKKPQNSGGAVLPILLARADGVIE